MISSDLITAAFAHFLMEYCILEYGIQKGIILSIKRYHSRRGSRSLVGSWGTAEGGDTHGVRPAPALLKAIEIVGRQVALAVTPTTFVLASALCFAS